ncbi:GumC family protein [Anabaena sp. UHCC 0253]|uniref:GumC family protein n=1 Tax=Anabaena sp. UHCC 0253 TaxID=2590019 RepID=UPI00352AA7C0
MATNGMKFKQILTTSISNVVNFRKITLIALHHRWFIFGVSCTVMSVTSLIAITAKPTYQSYMQILVSYNSNESASASNIEKQTPAVDYNSQKKLMLSAKLVQKAVNLLQTEYPQITVEDIYSDSATGKISSLEITKLPVQSRTSKNSSQIFSLSFIDRNPLKTKRVLQALQKVYQDYNTDQKNQRVNQGLAFVNNSVPKLQKDVMKAEKKLEQFRKENNLIDPVLQSKILLQSLSDLQKQRQKTRAQLEDIQARHNSLEQAIASANPSKTVDTTASNQYQALINELNTTEQALTQARVLYTEKYPIIQQLQQKRKIIIALIQQQEKNQTIPISNKLQPLVDINPKLENDLTQLKMTALGLIANDAYLMKSEQELRSQFNKYPSLITEYKGLVADIEIYRTTLKQLMQAQHSLGLKIAQEGFNWQILEEPALGIHIGNLRWLLIIGGIFISPILGLLAALAWEKFNQAIFYPQDLQKLTNIQLLGSVPKLGKKPDSWQRKLKNIGRNKRRDVDISLQENIRQLPNHEALDIIYQNIQILNNSLPLKSLMLTSALPGEGKTTLALGLGASAARMHQRVLVIDANLRSPSLHKTLGLTNDWGLSLLLIDDENTSFHNYIQPIHPAIDVLTAGPIPEDAVTLLSSERMKELIDLFGQNYDLVLIDAPSVLDTVDGRIVASLCNKIVMVGRIGQVTPNKLMAATEILSKLNLIGIVGNEVYDTPQILTP